MTVYKPLNVAFYFLEDTINYEREWLAHLAKNIYKSLLIKRVMGGGNYIWHIFSWELVDKDKYLEGDIARKFFIQIFTVEIDRI